MNSTTRRGWGALVTLLLASAPIALPVQAQELPAHVGAVQDRAMRIEVGYGLEGILPDGLAGEVIRESFLPRFRTDDYRLGVLEGTSARDRDRAAERDG